MGCMKKNGLYYYVQNHRFGGIFDPIWCQIHQNLSIEECAQILDELSTEFYENNLDPNELKVEET